MSVMIHFMFFFYAFVLPALSLTLSLTLSVTLTKARKPHLLFVLLVFIQWEQVGVNEFPPKASLPLR